MERGYEPCRCEPLASHRPSRYLELMEISGGVLGMNAKVKRGIDLVLEGVAEASAGALPSLTDDEYRHELDEIGHLRGRPLFLPYLSSGVGRGAHVQLADGRWVLDFALGIGVHFFGHGDPDLLRTALLAAIQDTAMQGNLQMGSAYGDLLALLLEHSGPRFRHAWIANCGAEANETALKIIRHRKQPATEIIAFRGCFHGRTTTMAEITDRPDYRPGQPARETVHYLPFYAPGDPSSARETHRQLRELLAARGRSIAALLVELVQGETGFRTAPAEFFRPLLEECRAAGIAIWVDEIQTFGRTGELFAFQKLGLVDLVDVVTVGKMIHCAVTLFTEEFLPPPGLVSGTFAGSTVGLATGRRIVERLVSGDYLGPAGRIAALGELAADHLKRLCWDLGPGRVSGFQGVGAMWALELAGGDHDAVVGLLGRCFDRGLMLYYGGTGPYRLRIFLPAGVLTEDELDEGFSVLRRCLQES